MILANSKERGRFLKFAIVGAIGAIIDLGAFNLLTIFLGLEALVAQAFSFSLAVINNFVWNRYWTYPDARNKPITRQLIQFVIVSIIGLTIRTLIFDRLEKGLIWLSQQMLPKDFVLSPVVVGHNLSLASVIIIILFWNFFVNRFWTYNDVN
jgi:putative flippase GtrA